MKSLAMKTPAMKALAALLLLAACGPPKPYFDEKSCPFKVNTTVVQGQNMRCGTLYTPEVHAKPDKLIAVPVLIFLSGKNARPPVVNLAGGPGQSWADLGLDTVPATLIEGLPQDYIFIEQRGTGLSTPRLDCPDQTADQSDNDYVTACAASLQKKKINLAAYNTEELADDVATLASVLGDAKIDLDGVSYGTAWAQQIVRAHSDILTGVIIDSVLSPASPPLGGDASGTDSAFTALFAACAANADCNSEYPDLENTMLSDIAALEKTPLPVSGTGNPLAAGDFFSVAQTILATSAPDVPNWILEVSNAIAAGSLTVDSNTQSDTSAESSATAGDALGQYFSVLCSDNQFVTFEQAEADTAKARIAFQPYVDESEFVTLCGLWPYQKRSLDDFTLVTSTVPTMILSGDLDPLTPPIWAEQVAKGFSQSTLVQVAGVGHDVSASADSCVEHIVQSFLTTPAVEDKTCSETIAAVFTAPGATSSARDSLVLAHDLKHRLPHWRRPRLDALFRAR